jgi:RNA polymerase sigma factor (sigma-70 family)
VNSVHWYLDAATALQFYGTSGLGGWSMSLPDHELRARLISGDEGALAELYDSFGFSVFQQALRATSDRIAAQDITQEVFVYIWTHPSRYDPDRSNFRTWLRMIAYRRGVDWVRQEVARRRRELASGAPDIVPSPAELTDTTVGHAMIRRAVDALPDHQRRAIHLAYFEGHTFRRVAATLGIPEGTVKSRLRAGLAALKRRLAAEGMP